MLNSVEELRLSLSFCLDKKKYCDSLSKGLSLNSVRKLNGDDDDNKVNGNDSHSHHHHRTTADT